MSIHVVCEYGAGDFPANPYAHVLITSEGDAVQKGFRILNDRYMIEKRYETRQFPCPAGAHFIRAAAWVTVDFPEASLKNVAAWVNHFEIETKPGEVWLSLTFSTYERSAA